MSNFTQEQIEAITTIKKNVVVSAGAGSGKTRVLVKRFVYILEKANALENLKTEVNADDILAITFTRKAAAEMKQRVREEIREKIELAQQMMIGAEAFDEDFPTHHSVSFWREQLKCLERTQISTIHSLCSRILHENPVEAQLDPNFVLAEDFAGEEFIENCLQEYLRQNIQNDNVAIKQLLEVYGFSTFSRQMISLLPDMSNILACKNICAPYQESVNNIQDLKDEICWQINYLVSERETLTNAKTKGRERLDNLAFEYEKIIADIKAEPARIDSLTNGMQGLSAAGKLKESVNKLKDLKSNLEAAYVDKNAISLVECWQSVLNDFNDFCQQQKQLYDILTYDDLENLAVDLLEKNEQIRKKYHQRFHYLMIDEFQDTNEKQRQLIYLLCGDNKDILSGHKLFIVGDPKQSIYRFRGADVSVFSAVKKEIASLGGSLLSLSQNFRSEKTILDACNKVFEQLLGTDTEQNVYFEALNHFWEKGSLKPDMLLVPYDKDMNDNKYLLEGRAIAQKILSMDFDNSAENDSNERFGKMAILVRAMTHVDELTQALQEYNIPYRVIDGRGFYEQQEVIDILNLFTVLHNRYRDLELAGILRSPYFGLSDITITQLFLAEDNCLWDALQNSIQSSDEEQGYLLQRAAEILSSLRQSASLMALPELWQQVWEKLAIDAVLSVQEHGNNKLANVDKLRKLSLEYSSENLLQGTLGGWLEYVRRLRSAQARETAANVTSNDSIQIMTIHKSKGLQFSTVILPMLDDSGSIDTSECKFVPEVGLGIKALNSNGDLVSTGVLQKAKDINKKLDLQERARLLYVAMTRAEEKLLLAGAVTNKEIDSKKSLQELNWLQVLQSVFTTDELVNISIYDANIPIAGLHKKSILSNEVNERILQPLPKGQKSSSKYLSATALRTYLYCPRQYYYHYVMQLPELEVSVYDDITQNLSAKITGLIIHRALELYNGNFEEAFFTAVNEYAPGKNAIKAQKMLQQYLTSKLYTDLPPTKMREVRFVLAYTDTIVIKGIIDYLAYNDNKELVLVDYKTGSVNDKPMDIAYMYQLAIYKYAAEKLLHKSVATAQLHFLQDLSVQELSLAKADIYLQQALAIYSEISKKKEENEFCCNLNHCLNCPYRYLCTQQ